MRIVLETPRKVSVAAGICGVGCAMILALAAAYFTRGGVSELPAFAFWSAPLGLVVHLLTRRRLFASWRPLLQCVALAFIGVVAGLGTTFVAYGLLGGMLLAFDFPVLYCWAIGGMVGMLAGGFLAGGLKLTHIGFAAVAALMPLAAMGWIGSRPDPALLVGVVPSAEGESVTTIVHDSLLTTPHPRQGRSFRWGINLYSLAHDPSGQPSIFLGFRNTQGRDSARIALRKSPLVKSVLDTTRSR